MSDRDVSWIIQEELGEQETSVGWNVDVNGDVRNVDVNGDLRNENQYGCAEEIIKEVPQSRENQVEDCLEQTDSTFVSSQSVYSARYNGRRGPPERQYASSSQPYQQGQSNSNYLVKSQGKPNRDRQPHSFNRKAKYEFNLVALPDATTRISFNAGEDSARHPARDSMRISVKEGWKDGGNVSSQFVTDNAIDRNFSWADEASAISNELSPSQPEEACNASTIAAVSTADQLPDRNNCALDSTKTQSLVTKSGDALIVEPAVAKDDQMSSISAIPTTLIQSPQMARASLSSQSSQNQPFEQASLPSPHNSQWMTCPYCHHCYLYPPIAPVIQPPFERNQLNSL